MKVHKLQHRDLFPVFFLFPSGELVLVSHSFCRSNTVGKHPGSISLLSREYQLCLDTVRHSGHVGRWIPCSLGWDREGVWGGSMLLEYSGWVRRVLLGYLLLLYLGGLDLIF